MSQPDASMTLSFKCPEALLGLVPEPVRAVQGLPAWLKDMPQQAYSQTIGATDDTVKSCPPFIDAMTAGFLIPLAWDVRVEDGAFSWDNDVPPGGITGFPRSPIGFQDGGQVSGTPLFGADRFLLKFLNVWTVEAPLGYSLLFTHPANRPDLPFTTLSGLVDCDRYHDLPIHFPAHWRDPGFSGLLPRGTPIAQCFPVKRETWVARIGGLTEAERRSAHDLAGAIGREKGVYRRRFRA